MSENLDEKKTIQNKNYKTSSLTLKAFLLFFVSCTLLVPLFMLEDFVNERKYNADKAIESVGKAWGNDIFHTPYISENENAKEGIAPQKLELWVDLKYQERKKGFYKVPVYTAFVDLMRVLV